MSEAATAGRREQILATGLAVCAGLLVEVVITGLIAGIRGNLIGHVSLLMSPVYAVALHLVEPIRHGLRRHGLFGPRVRIPIVVLVIYGIEWASGAVYRSIGLEPWRYDHGMASEFSDGLITLWYIPLWLCLAASVFAIERTIRSTAARLNRAI